MSNYSERFLEYLMEQEHGAFMRGDAPALHESPEGGNPTVGFGHKLTDKEVREGKVYGYDIQTMTPEQARDVMMKDLAKKEETLKRSIGEETYENLDQTRREMLLDFEYNLGSAKEVFPTFTQAVIDNDIETMNREYKRGYYTPDGQFRELRQRNNAFAVTFLPSAEGVRQFEDIRVPEEPGTLDFQLPPIQELPEAEAVQEVSEDELMGRKVYLSRLLD